MKKFYLMMLAMLTAIAANAWTVKFTNPDNWSQVAVWAWDDSGNYTGGVWPGKLMTKQGNVWVYTDDSTTGVPQKIIFNNNDNGQQTNDLNFVNGATYDKNGVLGAVITYIDIYVPYYLYKSETAYIYTWSPNIFGEWPGKEMQKVTKNGIEFWTIKVDDQNIGATPEWKLSGKIGETSNCPAITILPDYVYELDGTSTPLADYKLPDDTSDKITYNLHGTIFGTTEWVDYEMTVTDGVWSYTGNAVAGDFGIAQMTNGSQSAWYSADGKNTITESGVYNCKENGTNFSNQLTGEVTFAFDPEALTLTVTGGQIEQIDYTSWYLNVLGDFNSWGDNGITLNADGVGTNPDLEIGNGGFKLKIWNGTADMWLSTGSALLAGKAYSITGNADANMTIDGAKAGYTYNVTYDAVNQTMQVDWAGEPLEVFVIGELKEKYQAGDEIRFGTNYPDEATIYFTFGSDIEIPDFGLIDVPEDQPAAAPRKLPTATDYNTTGINIYNPDQPIVFQDEALALNYVAYSKAMGASAGQRLVIGANGETTGIENVAVDSNDAPVEFFNLQGVRVANPSNGVFIRRQGNTASKVYVK